MRRYVPVVALLAGLVLLSGCATSMKMGAPMSNPPAAVSADLVKSKSADMAGKPARITGVVSAVCDGEPWFEIAANADEKNMDRVVLVAYECDKCKCSVPAAAKGKKAVVEGPVQMFDMPADAAKHYAEAKGWPKEQTAKLSGGIKIAKVKASYVEIEGVACPMGAGTCDGQTCGAGTKCCADPKKCDNPKCRETGKCQASCAAGGAKAATCCGSEACKTAGKCVGDKDAKAAGKK
jgi:hypothetical protein